MIYSLSLQAAYSNPGAIKWQIRKRKKWWDIGLLEESAVGGARTASGIAKYEISSIWFQKWSSAVEN